MLVGHTRLSSYRAIVLLGLGLIATCYFFVERIDWNTLSSASHWNEHSSASAIFALKIVPFWKELSTSLEDARPQCPPIETPEEAMPTHDKEWEPLAHKNRPERLNLSEKDELELMKAHRKMRIATRRLGPLLPVGQDTGIVTTGGVKLFPVLLVSLRMLRRTGCTLPVQVFLGDRAEYAAVRNVCEDVLPGLNARCFVVSDVYSKGTATPPDHYQFKILAILFSSFKNILFLDADSNVAHNPTALLNSPPFTTHGLVVWPEFYSLTSSAHFYDIAGIPVPPITRGTESGQLLINKEQHRESLLMMLYYNYYGPNYYYPLQAQGGPGQGDKDTFVAAAMAVSAPYYAVKSPVRPLGHHSDRFHFTGAAQADPIQDFRYEPPSPNHLLANYQWDAKDKIGAQQPENAKARAFFVHTVTNNAKLNPGMLLKEGGPAWDSNGKGIRIWGEADSLTQLFGYDVERRMWDCVQEEACRMDESLCTAAKRHNEQVYSIKAA